MQITAASAEEMKTAASIIAVEIALGEKRGASTKKLNAYFHMVYELSFAVALATLR